MNLDFVAINKMDRVAARAGMPTYSDLLAAIHKIATTEVTEDYPQMAKAVASEIAMRIMSGHR